MPKQAYHKKREEKSERDQKRKEQSERDRILRAEREFRLHPADNSRVIEKYFVALGTPVALSCYMLYKYGEHDQLVTKEIWPSSYNDAARFRDDFAAVSFLRKHEGLKTTFNRKQSALQTFAEGEVACEATNTRIRRYLLGDQTSRPDELLLSGAIRKIERILGTFSIGEAFETCGWGPGTTLAVKGADCSGARKFDVDCDFTADAYDLFGPALVSAFPKWVNLETPTLRTGNVVSTVPKNAKTERTIAVEPGGNSWLQSGIGRSIRKRLRFSGYNLSSDLKNQRGAYIGSIDDSLATIDFKAASDTISIEAVRLLVPADWFTVMDAARSKLYTLRFTHRSQKFSTMGNGFTFELESLIFLSLALAICEAKGLDDSGVSIFGDDLVLPKECVPELTDLCTFLGFTINAQKSFSSGPFRESCGAYYFNGLDVKPLYLKTDLLYVKDIYRLANAIRGLSHRIVLWNGCDLRFRSIWSLLVHLVPSAVRLLGPVDGGDAVIHDNLVSSGARANEDGWSGYNYSGIPDIAVDIKKDSFGLLLAKLNRRSRDLTDMHYYLPEGKLKTLAQRLAWMFPPSTPDELPGNKVSLRERTRTVHIADMYVHAWYDFGPWITRS